MQLYARTWVGMGTCIYIQHGTHSLHMREAIKFDIFISIDCAGVVRFICLLAVNLRALRSAVL